MPPKPLRRRGRYQGSSRDAARPHRYDRRCVVWHLRRALAVDDLPCHDQRAIPPFRSDDPKFGEQTSDHIYQLRSLTDEQAAASMQRQRRLLLTQLHRNEAHRRPRDRPWTCGGSLNAIRDLAHIVHIDEDGKERTKHLHDVRGTFCTMLLTECNLTDEEAADIMAWSPERVRGIRKVYVDESRARMALAARVGAKQKAKQDAQ